MVGVKLFGHDFRYEVFQIVSLFFKKEDICFEGENNELVIESIVNSEVSSAGCRLTKNSTDVISEFVVTDTSNKKNIKNSIKLTLLRALEKYTGTKIPWGILVGIRPTKIVHEYFKSGLCDKDILEKMNTDYEVIPDKALLALEVAKNESKFLNSNKKDVSLYLGIPFCPTRCSYCSFTSNPIGGNLPLVDNYVDSLCYEIQCTMDYINANGFKVDTLYIGGGTPTSLSHIQLGRIIEYLHRHIRIDGLREFTIEAGRPDSIDIDKLKVIKASGCTRISINPQTMNDHTLKTIGRMHSVKDVIDKFEMARSIGFDNINMDIIIGLPGEGETEIENTMRALSKLSPENITLHTMAIKRASVLNEMDYSRRSSIAIKMYDIAVDAIRNMGLYPYYMYRQKNMVSPLENIGFCKENRECIYNIQMIAENISIVALGADAVTKLVFKDENRIERVANVKDVREYINRIEEMIEKKKNGISTLLI